MLVGKGGKIIITPAARLFTAPPSIAGEGIYVGNVSSRPVARVHVKDGPRLSGAPASPESIEVLGKPENFAQSTPLSCTELVKKVAEQRGGPGLSDSTINLR